MDIQEQIADALVRMNKQLTDNHLEVCQRLTTVETTLTLQAPLEERVKTLEGWRSKVIGFTVAINMAWAGVLAWAKHR